MMMFSEEPVTTGDTSVKISSSHQTVQSPDRSTPGSRQTSDSCVTKPRSAKSPERSDNNRPQKTPDKANDGKFNIEQISKLKVALKLPVESVNSRERSPSSCTSTSGEHREKRPSSPMPSSATSSPLIKRARLN